MDQRLTLLSSNVVNYSLDVKKGDIVLITINSTKARELVKNLIKDIHLKGGISYTKIIDDDINAFAMSLIEKDGIKLYADYKDFEVDHYDCFINIRYSQNDFINKNLKSKVRKDFGEATKEADDIRINKRRWVLLNYPSILDAHKAKMTNHEFYNHALDVMTFDYKKMCEDIQPLKKLLESTNKVHLVTPTTDLTLSIKDIPKIPCCGEYNLPDGEIYTAPVKDSVNGYITFNTPCPYQGYIYNNVKLTFKDGKIIDATCNEDSTRLNEIFDIDEGSRYVGEFAIGLNPLIKDPIGDILYDEKIIGSIHLTPGRCYENASNGNDSSIHWDMVMIETSKYGGGKMYFDDVLVRENGLWVIKELLHLNYN